MNEKGEAGSYILEVLTRGMYDNPLHMYREYIQNAVDSIDQAVKIGILSSRDDSEIRINIDKKNREITIKDNGVGIPVNTVENVLLNIGKSTKDGNGQRGFRGIGRLCGLAYADRVDFITSSVGESKKTIQSCDCIKMNEIIDKKNANKIGVMDAFRKICSFSFEEEDSQAHYFEVHMYGVDTSSHLCLLDETKVTSYIQQTAPIDFDTQKFIWSEEIRRHFDDIGAPIKTYNILLGKRKKHLCKLYSNSIQTGKTNARKITDRVKGIEYVEEKDSSGNLLYAGWLALTDFHNSVKDDKISGIRLRVGNILVGDSKSFEKYFPSEGSVANRLFVGEIHIISENVIPNSQRNDFETNEAYNEMFSYLQEWARKLNKNYRRGTSELNRAIVENEELDKKQEELEKKVKTQITSETKREYLINETEKLKRKRRSNEKKLQKALKNNIISDDKKKDNVEKILEDSTKRREETEKIKNEISHADYSTKKDLPSSYSKAERKVYERIIGVIDKFFNKDEKTAEALRNAIVEELQVKKKR